MAGRTDAGVHARGQVASFVATEIPGDLTRRLNGIGPRDLGSVVALVWSQLELSARGLLTEAG